MLVPPKNVETAQGIFICRESRMGMMAITVRKTAPARVMRLMALCRYSLVGLAGTNPGNVTAVLLEIIGDLQLVELRRHPEIREEQNHQRIDKNINEGAFGQRCGDFHERLGKELAAGILSARQGLTREQEQLLREHQDRRGENDGHDARVIDSQRHERSAAGVDLTAHRPLSILNRHLALSLSDGDHARDHAHQQQATTPSHDQC